MEALESLGRADIERRAFLTSAAYSVAAAALPLGVAGEYAQRTAHTLAGRRAGAPEVEAVQDMTRMFTAIDERHGGQHGRETVVTYLTRDVLSLCRARALAETGQITAARAQAAAARELAHAGTTDELRGWASMWGTPVGAVDAHTARIYTAVGDWAAAQRHHAAARRRYGRDRHRRIAALSAAAEGHALLRQGQIEAACTTWNQALDDMSGIGSSRTVAAVRSIRRDLAQFTRRGARPALALEDRARHWLADIA
ncbi:hypothetical protein [Streptomyces sp. NPDC005805]|uniref:hypothetical protein n=1 Tax=Streptomyces sp. NPDC005805 TaxID=3157068 RepID=UPI0034098D91